MTTREEIAAVVAEAIGEKPALEIADARPPEFSDEALAQSFAERHSSTLRYVAAWSRWYVWTGNRWRLDETLESFDRARAVCRAIASRAKKPKIQSAVASAKSVAAVERLAKADRRIAATTDVWDANLDTLNTPEVTT